MAESSYTAVTALASVSERSLPPVASQKSEKNPEVSQDAVSVSLSSDAPRKKEDVSPQEREKAEQLAQAFAQKLNSTALKFDVQLFDKNKKVGGFLSAFSFKVVNKETGEVVRQFPPEAIIDADLKPASPPTGMLVSKSV